MMAPLPQPHPCPRPAALWDDPAALSVHTVQPFNPITRCPWYQSAHSSLLRHLPRRRQETKPSPLETTAVSGGNSPALPIHGAGVLPRECPTLPILIMHLLLIRVLESLAVPTVPATGRQGSELKSPSLPSSHKHSKSSACQGCGQPDKTLGHPPAASLHLPGLTLWPGSKHSAGAPQGLAVFKACVLCMPGSAMLTQSTQPPLHLSDVEKISPLLTYPPVYPGSPCAGSSSGTATAIAHATDTLYIIYYSIYTDLLLFSLLA